MTEFEEYLRGTFEINNGVENDVDNLVRIHAPELFKLAKKELMKDAEQIRFNCLLPCSTFNRLKAKGCEIGDKLLIIKE